MAFDADSNLTGKELLTRIYYGQFDMQRDLKELADGHLKLAKLVYGNGDPGLAGDVRDLKGKISDVTKVALALVVPLTLAVLGLLWGLLTNRIELITK